MALPHYSSLPNPCLVIRSCVKLWGGPMKKILVAAVATLIAVSVAGCAAVGFGKGKAPPPVVTKG